ncbi:FHIPEP family type III secretion protein [bacterium]|nr:FHIPEP family type III secretion protein [bacterium]
MNYFSKNFKLYFLREDKNRDKVLSQFEKMFSELKEDVVRFEMGTDLVPFTDKIVDVLYKFREKKFSETGFIFPLVHCIDNDRLQENEYRIYVQGELVDIGFVVFNESEIRKEFSQALENLFNDYLEDIFTNETTEKYISSVYANNYYLVQEIRRYYDMCEIKSILVNMLRNSKSIKNIRRIVETICEVNTDNIKLTNKIVSVTRMSEILCE